MSEYTASQLNNLGIRAQQTGQNALAVQYLTEACRLTPHDPQLFYNLGWVWQTQGNLAAAVSCYETALHLKPNYLTARLNLAVALGDLGQLGAAIEQLQRLIPTSKPEIYFNLGNLWRKQGDLQEAIRAYQQALELAPDMAEIYYNLGVTWARLDEIEAARQAYQQAIQCQPHQVLWQLARDSLAPAIMPPRPELEAWRAHFEQALNHYAPIDLGTWLNELTVSNVKPPFYLTYHGYNDRPLKEKFAALFRAPAPPPHRPKSHPPYKIGFVVTQQHEGIFNLLMTGWLNQWPDAELQPVIICPAESAALIQPYIHNEQVTFFNLSPHLPTALTELYAAHFDLLYFWEVGTDALNYFLPFFRLAPVQCTSWGIPATTGLPMMDYYLSSEWLEEASAVKYYTEKLIRLKNLPVYYEKPSIIPPPAASTSAHIYLCPQSLFKLHPDFDAICAEILRRDPQGELWLIEGLIPTWRERLLSRFPPDILPQIRVQPRQTRQGFLELLTQAAVMLDPLHYGGTNTTYEGLALGVPIVTMPTEFLKGRITMGCYRKMGILDCVVNSPAAYVEQAVRLGTDQAYRARIKAQIMARHEVLYEDNAAVYELTAFLKQAILQRDYEQEQTRTI